MDQLANRIHAGSRISYAWVILMCCDAITLLLALSLSLYLRADSFSEVLDVLYQHRIVIPIALSLYITIFAAFHLYRYAWRFASLEIIWDIVFANSLGMAALIACQYMLGGQQIFPWRTLAIFLIVSIIAVGGERILLRLLNIHRHYGARMFWKMRRDTRPKRVAIIGSGPEVAHLIAMLHENHHDTHEVVGILDDTPQKRGLLIRGVRIIGPPSLLQKLLTDHAIDEVLIAYPHPPGEKLREYVLACRKEQVSIKTVPGLRDVLRGQKIVQLPEVSVEDLLRRQPVSSDMTPVGEYVGGKRVLVTGAGGSIGSELCRQIMAAQPARLILLGHGENSIHSIYHELRATFPEAAGNLDMVIASVAENGPLTNAVSRYRPQVVFHAAAHKHVPIMESNIPEAVQNNILGTCNVAEACGILGVERMVAISTDKAVYPTSIMGATKWMCEEVLQAMARRFPDTSYITVRFGNVLGSRGSVVPIFREQIKRGGPVTVTHPEMTRYFMTIPEAVQLVLHAGAIGHSGELFLLNMGQPVKILDLARDTIRLSGFEPDVDIPIAFSGLRPGEKLHERLTMDDEALKPTQNPNLSVVNRLNHFSPAEIWGIVRKFHHLVEVGETPELLDLLKTVVPDFSFQAPPASESSVKEKVLVAP